MRYLSIDIETRPNLAYVWELYGRGLQRGINTEALVEAKEMMCFAAKWLGEDEDPYFFSTFHDGSTGMVAGAWDLLNKADALVYYNGNRFDEPHLNRAILAAKFPPPSPYKKIDLYRTVKTRFAFPSGKLDYVAQELGVGEKVKHSGFNLWKRCIADDPEAWEEMKRYNIQDVVLNEELFNVLRPWIANLPSIGAELGMDVCPACGSERLVKEGFRFTKTGRYQRYRCRDCSTWLSSSRREAGTQITQEARL